MPDFPRGTVSVPGAVCGVTELLQCVYCSCFHWSVSLLMQGQLAFTDGHQTNAMLEMSREACFTWISLSGGPQGAGWNTLLFARFKVVQRRLDQNIALLLLQLDSQRGLINETHSNFFPINQMQRERRQVTQHAPQREV